jgi:hypothetical protein
MKRPGCDVEQVSHPTHSVRRTRSRIRPSALPATELESRRQQLEGEPPRLVHQGKALGTVRKLVQWGFGALLGVAVGLVCLGLTFHLLGQGETVAAAVAGLFALLALMFGLTAPAMMVAWWTQRVRRIEVCPSGLRWSRRGRTRLAAWAEVLFVQRVESESYQGPIVGMGALIAAASATAPRRKVSRSDSLLLELPDGRLRADAATLTDYGEFADSVQLHHASEARRLEFGLEEPTGGDQGVRNSAPQPFIPLGDLRGRV